MRRCRIIAKDPPIDISIPMGEGPAVPTGGFGGWKAVQRQDDVSVTDWEGQEPLTQDVPLLLNGYESDESVEREWNTVKKLGRDPNGDEHKPPAFKVFGPIDGPEGKSWVLAEGGIEVNPASILKRPGSGELLRIEFTLHLLEYIRPGVIRSRRRRRIGIGRAQALTYTTHPGQTLAGIAATQLGDWKLWKEIGRKNGIADPFRLLPAGRVLKLP